MANEFFISYSRRDLVFARTLVQGLKEHGVDPWFDQEDIPPASLWENDIKEGIDKCQNFGFLISDFSCKSIYCLAELNQALLSNKRIIPIVCPENTVDPSFVHPSLKELNWIFFNNIKQGFEFLISLIESPEGFLKKDMLSSKITICTEGLTNRHVGLYRRKYEVGRNPRTDVLTQGCIVIEDPWVSRTHFRLSLDGDRWTIEDNSRNGTRVNGHRVRGIRPLRHKDEISISPITKISYEEIFATELTPSGDDKSTLF